MLSFNFNFYFLTYIKSRRIRGFFILFSVLQLSLWSETFLLSIPRSGSHWLIYGLEYLTLQSFSNGSLYYQGIVADINKDFVNPFKLDLDINKSPIVIRTHSVLWTKQFDKSDNKLILIVRDPFHFFLREYLKIQNYNVMQKHVDYYLSYLELFDNWDKSNRYLIYYHELKNHPEIVFKEILDFLNKSDTRLYDFLNNINSLEKQAFQAYFQHFKTYKSPEKQLFKSEVIQNLKKEIHLKFLETNSDLFRKYLAIFFDEF